MGGEGRHLSPGSGSRLIADPDLVGRSGEDHLSVSFPSWSPTWFLPVLALHVAKGSSHGLGRCPSCSPASCGGGGGGVPQLTGWAPRPWATRPLGTWATGRRGKETSAVSCCCLREWRPYAAHATFSFGEQDWECRGFQIFLAAKVVGELARTSEQSWPSSGF